MKKKTRKVEIEVPEHSVVIAFSAEELESIYSVLNLFDKQEDRVWKSAGITNKKIEKIFINKLIEIEKTYLQNFDGIHIVRQMEEGNSLPYRQVYFD